jgi:hypothetical protein
MGEELTAVLLRQQNNKNVKSASFHIYVIKQIGAKLYPGCQRKNFTVQQRSLADNPLGRLMLDEELPEGSSS